MSFESYIGLRYLKSRKSSAFLSTITSITVGGVAVGVCALIVVLAVMAGFEDELRDKIIGTNAHGNLMKDAGGFADYGEARRIMLGVPGVVAATPFIMREVMISSESNVTGALFKGIDPESVDSVIKLREQLEEGSLEYVEDPHKLLIDSNTQIQQRIDKGEFLPGFSSRTKRKWGDKELPGIILGREMAKYLAVWTGDEVNVVNPLGGGLGPTGPIPSSKYFRVAGVFYTGMFEYDMKLVYTSIPVLQKFSSMDNEVTAIEFRVEEDRLFDTEEIGKEIVTELGGFPFKVKDWKELNGNLFAALKLEQFVMFVILTFITLVAAFNIASTLIMMVIEKTREIAILKSMGASKSSIMKMFWIQGFIIGLVGTLIGSVIGFGLVAIIPLIDLQLDPKVYYMTSLPVRVEPVHIAAIISSALLISWLATFYPAWQAARMNPVDGLRND